MTNGWIEVAQEALKVPGLLVEIYGDLAKPGVRQVGKALDTVIGLGNTVLWPIAWANERSRLYLERNLEAYREKLAQLPLEKIIPVAPEIGVPIAEKLAYVQDQKLSELYVALLVTASNEDTVSQAHPSFVNVINNLSPDEAQLLEYFFNNPADDLQFVTAKWVHPKTGVYSFAGDLLLDPEQSTGLAFPQNIPAYISNFAGLGIASIHHDRSVHGSVIYSNIEAHWTSVLPVVDPVDPERTLNFERGVIGVTEFGRLFIEACHED